MIKTAKILESEYKNYVNPFGKIKRLVKSNALFPIIKGLYETNCNVDGFYLASSIYSPSYLSFDFALSYYGLIPERVYTFTCATCLKKKTKKYETTFGNFTYQDVPYSVFNLCLNIKNENGYLYLIASKEKALCDKLYSLKSIPSQEKLKILLFDDLRIDKDEFSKLDKNDINTLAKLYKSKNVTLLSKYMKKVLK